jgi:outer membrane lipoprotein-sorting protein
VNLFRRLPLSRLLLLCGLIVAIGVSATALASALGGGPTPPAKPLAQAIHDSLAGPPVDGVSANVTLTNRLLEGANLAGGGELASNPLLTGASGRLWIAKDGRARLELQAERGDTQVIYDGHTVSVYDAATNTLYRYTPKEGAGGSHATESGDHEAPSVAKIEEGLSHLGKHANVSDATPTDVGGQPAYTVRVSPKEGGSLFGGVELSFDAAHAVPLRAAVYSSSSSSPVIELSASDVAYGSVDPSVFAFSPPADAKVEDISASSSAKPQEKPASKDSPPKLTSRGHGISSIAVVEAPAKSGTTQSGSLEDLPKVDVNGVKASELRTALGTFLAFERGGVRYVVAGSVPPAAVEAIAQGL